MFLLAAKKLDIEPKECLVVEDADAGVEAALAGNMKVLAVGYASKNKNATLTMKDLQSFNYDKIKNLN